MAFQNVTLVGGGVLGAQIAFQSAFKGFHVTIWLRSEGSIGRTQPKIDLIRQSYLKELAGLRANLGNPSYNYPRGIVDSMEGLDAAKIDALEKQVEEAYHSLKITLDLAEAVKDADLVIEAMAENLEQKRDIFQKMAPLLPEKTVLVTNSSTLLPSAMADATGRPEKFLALHFANEIWRFNTAEVMGQPKTDPKYYGQVVEFAKQISMIPLCLKKEQPGYILNSMLVPFLFSAESLAANDVADPETIDQTWRLATGAPSGPFRMLDVVGLTTAYNIALMTPGADNPDSNAGKILAFLKKYIDAGKTGMAAGEGFYKYKK